jgi:hypothetical protein
MSADPESAEDIRTFHFNTGVRVHAYHNPPIHVAPGHIVDSRGVLQIPFQCRGVPERAVFKFACNHTPPGSEHLLRDEIIGENGLCSKYAFFQIYPTE